MISDTELETRLAEFELEIAELVAALIPEIGDEYRATDDPEDTEPGMCLTIGTDDEAASWSYQTGDNSYTGGAYGSPHWAVVYLSRESDPAVVAREACEELAEMLYGAGMVQSC